MYYFSSAAVASSDIQPTNGVVHALAVYFNGATSSGSSITINGVTVSVNTNLTGELVVNPTMQNIFGMSVAAGANSIEFDREVFLTK